MELLSEKSHGSIPDQMPVHPSDRHHFHTCVGDKALLRLMDRFDPKMPLVNRDLQLSSEGEHDFARDAVQQAARKCRSTEAASSNEEQVADGAFRQMRFPVE